MVVPPARDDLRRNVLWGAAHAISGLILRVADLGQSKVGELDVPIAIQQDIFGLDVPVDDIPGVQVLKCQEELGCVELGHLLVETTAAPEQVEQFALS